MSTVAPKSSTAKRRATPSPEAASDAARSSAVAELEAEERIAASAGPVAPATVPAEPHRSLALTPNPNGFTDLATIVRSAPGAVEQLLYAFTCEDSRRDWVDGALTGLADDLVVLHDAIGNASEAHVCDSIFRLEHRLRAVAVVGEAIRAEVSK